MLGPLEGALDSEHTQVHALLGVCESVERHGSSPSESREKIRHVQLDVFRNIAGAQPECAVMVHPSRVRNRKRKQRTMVCARDDGDRHAERHFQRRRFDTPY